MLALYEGEADIGPTRDAVMFEPPDGVFVLVREGDRPVACGGIARFDADRAEVKRMYVVPDARGRGLGRRVLAELEELARSFGYTGLVLETGDRSEAALAIYTSSGFERIPSYPPYDTRELSLCFQKRL